MALGSLFGIPSPYSSDDNRNLALAASIGLLSGQTGTQQAANAGQAVLPLMMQQQQQQKALAEQNKTLQYLEQTNPQLAAQVRAGLPIAQAWQQQLEAQKPKKPNYMAVDGALFNTDNQQWITPPEGVSRPKLTDDQREYSMAKEQGFPGTFMDWQIKMKEAGRNQVNIDTGAKLPSGFRWIDPKDQNKGVEAIPGGPATQIPSELAARVGMAESFQQDLPGIKQKIASGILTGPIDRATAGNVDSSEGAAVYRKIQSGADALMRLLTGAGMNQTEAQAYAQRYLPSYTDDVNSLNLKVDQLAKELNSAKDKAMRGRGDPSATVPGPANAGVTSWQDYFKGP